MLEGGVVIPEMMLREAERVMREHPHRRRTHGVSHLQQFLADRQRDVELRGDHVV